MFFLSSLDRTMKVRKFYQFFFIETPRKVLKIPFPQMARRLYSLSIDIELCFQ